MSHEGGSERSQRTVAELLAMYGGDSAERAPRRRRRRPDDVSDTAPQAIADRILSESGKLSPIRDDQPPPERTSHRQRPAPEPPAPPRRAQAPPPVSAAPAPSAPSPPPRTQLPPPPPQPTQRPPLPLPPRPDEPAIAQASEPTRPVRPRRARRAPPPQQAPFPPPDGGQPIRRDNGAHPEPTTEQLPRIPTREERGGNRGPRPGEPPPALGSGPRPAPAPFPTAHLPRDPFATNVINPGAQTGFPRDSLETVAPGRGHHVDGYPEADLDLDERDAPLDDYPGYSDEDDAAYADDDDDLDERREDTSAAREWLIMAGQVALSVLGGAAVWLGFNWLWGELPQAALGAAVLVIVGLVWIVRKLRKADDLQTTVLAVLVGLVVTVSPAALLLVGR